MFSFLSFRFYSDEDCAEGLYCYMRSHGTPHVPGCLGEPIAEPRADTRDFCVSNAYRWSEGGPNVDHLLIEGAATDHPTYTFPNPVHFMGLLQDYWGDGIGETNRRDAEYETSAILEHYFYHPNTAPFVCIRLMQRAGLSNPSPRYVAACSNAFRTGAYTTSGGVSFGSGKYGDLAATTAAIHLDREVNSPVLDLEPGFGALREPLLKPIGLMRALDYAHLERTLPSCGSCAIASAKSRMSSQQSFPTFFLNIFLRLLLRAWPLTCRRSQCCWTCPRTLKCSTASFRWSSTV